MLDADERKQIFSEKKGITVKRERNNIQHN